MLQFKNTTREPAELTMQHKHYGELSTVMSRRVLDEDKQAKIHTLMWRWNQHRSQWEAQCERDDIIYICPGTDADIPLRRGRMI